MRSFVDARIRYMRHAHAMGGSAARNTGIRHAIAPLIAFLDDDDEWLQRKVEFQLKLLQALPDEVGCVYTGFEILDKDMNHRVGLKIPRHRGDLREILLDGNVVGTTSTVLLRKVYLESAGLFDNELPSMQDYDLWLRLARHCRFEYIEAPLVRYRSHGVCISASLDGLERGLRRLLKKHGSPNRLKRTCSRLLLDVGVGYAESGRMQDAARTLALTVLLNPGDAAAYYYFVSCLLGGRGYRGIQHLRDGIVLSCHELPA